MPTLRLFFFKSDIQEIFRYVFYFIWKLLVLCKSNSNFYPDKNFTPRVWSRDRVPWEETRNNTVLRDPSKRILSFLDRLSRPIERKKMKRWENRARVSTTRIVTKEAEATLTGIVFPSREGKNKGNKLGYVRDKSGPRSPCRAMRKILRTNSSNTDDALDAKQNGWYVEKRRERREFGGKLKDEKETTVRRAGIK